MFGRREKHKVSSEGGATTYGRLTNTRQKDVPFGDVTGGLVPDIRVLAPTKSKGWHFDATHATLTRQEVQYLKHHKSSTNCQRTLISNNVNNINLVKNMFVNRLTRSSRFKTLSQWVH